MPLLVFLAALALFLPLSGHIPITDPVEANYALTAKEMLMSGDWLSPSIYGQYWFDKPAMIYWLIAASYAVFGVGEFAARFPAALFSAAGVGFACWFAVRLYGSRQAGLLAAVVLGTSLEFWVIARMVITDAVLFFFTSVSLASFYLGLKGEGRGWFIPAYAAAGLSVLTKGPVGLVMPALVVFVHLILARRWELFKRLRIFSGAAIFLVVAAPWYLAMYVAHGRDFVDTFLGLHNYLRATVSEHPQDNVFYYYLILFPVSLLPWTGVFLRTLWTGRKRPHFAFLAVWIGVFIAFYTLMATKYLTYVFPALFPAALLVARELDEMQAQRPRALLWLSLPAVLLLAAFAAGGAWLPAAAWWPLQLTAVAGAAAVLWLGYRGEAFFQPLAAGAAVVVVSLLMIYQVLIPMAAARSAKEAAAVLPAKGAVVGAVGDYHTSAVFYSGYAIPRLVETVTPPASVWAGKYTMPAETTAAFAARTAGLSEVYLLVGRGGEAMPGYTKIASFPRIAVYKKESGR
ncbi:ArnT family glycosyltransferase [Anaeroselena agilis]|uniref:Glycosyltransferase family 39 protein n=1 Tax=Anaeroselena agilis TaxID=3063788 RepID=A0ABU3NY87_9FIRM|nr:glycosyltransferase family 39 protein [Selenomonadales bacterium 4137-cl]